MGLFGKAKKAPAPTAAQGIAGLNDAMDMLEKKEAHLEKKIQAEVAIIKANATKNRKVAMMALKRKKMYEQQINNLMGTRTTMEAQKMQLETMTITKNNLDAMRTASAGMKAITGNMDLDMVDDMRDEIEEQMEIGQSINEALAQPMGMAAQFDDDELDAELDMLEQEDLDEKLLDVGEVDTAPAMPDVPSHTPQPTAAKRKANPEDDELAALEAAMAM